MTRADREPYWYVAEALAWIAYRDLHAVLLVSKRMEEARSSGESDEALELLATPFGARNKTGAQLLPAMDYQEAFSSLLRACRQEKIVAEGRRVGRHRRGRHSPVGRWETTDVERWHDGAVEWLDLELEVPYCGKRVVLFVEEASFVGFLACFRFLQADVMATWPVPDDTPLSELLVAAGQLAPQMEDPGDHVEPIKSSRTRTGEPGQHSTKAARAIAEYERRRDAGELPPSLPKGRTALYQEIAETVDCDLTGVAKALKSLLDEDFPKT